MYDIDSPSMPHAVRSFIRREVQRCVYFCCSRNPTAVGVIVCNVARLLNTGTLKGVVGDGYIKAMAQIFIMSQVQRLNLWATMVADEDYCDIYIQLPDNSKFDTYLYECDDYDYDQTITEN